MIEQDDGSFSKKHPYAGDNFDIMEHLRMRVHQSLPSPGEALKSVVSILKLDENEQDLCKTPIFSFRHIPEISTTAIVDCFHHETGKYDLKDPA